MVLGRDLEHLHENVSLLTSDDMDKLRTLALDREEWNALTSRVLEAGKAEKSEDI